MKRDDAEQAPTVGKDMEESDGDMEVDAAEGSDDEHINVVPSYQSKVVSTAALTADKSKTHVIDPITGKSIPVSDLSEHMRIQLMDPKWQEERKKFIDKQRDSNIVGGDDIASNIASFAKERGDLFGSSEQELLNQEADSRKRLEKANRIIREQAQPGPSLPPPLPGPPLPQTPRLLRQLLHGNGLRQLIRNRLQKGCPSLKEQGLMNVPHRSPHACPHPTSQQLLLCLLRLRLLRLSKVCRHPPLWRLARLLFLQRSSLPPCQTHKK